MNEPPTQARNGPDQPDAAGPADTGAENVFLESDVSCVACGYNLRGLRPGGRCPECGRAVADSFKSEHLSCADPRYVRSLKRGLGILACGFGSLAAANLIFVLLLAVFNLLTLGMWGSPLANLALGISDWLGEFMSYVTAPVILLGALLVCRQDPGRPRLGRRWRQVSRWALALDVAVEIGVDLYLRFGHKPMQPILWQEAICLSLSLAISAAGLFACLVCLEQLSWRTDRPNIARWLRVCRWGIVVSAVFHSTDWLFNSFLGWVIVGRTFTNDQLWWIYFLPAAWALAAAITGLFAIAPLTLVVIRLRRAVTLAAGRQCCLKVPYRSCHSPAGGAITPER